MSRVEVLKTYKLYINGKFSRTESGRYLKINDSKGNLLANICRASRKDLRNSVRAADKAQSAWAARSAFNRGQILYRIAENLEGRKAEFRDILTKEQGLTEANSKKAVENAIDTFIYFAGWTDKYSAIYSTVNPVSSSHFNFSIPEAVGVVGVLSGESLSFPKMAAIFSAIIAGGNSMLIQIGEKASLSAMVLAEVIHHSDVPAGVVNILTGYQSELLDHMGGHMEIKSLLYLDDDQSMKKQIEELSVLNLKRLVHWKAENYQELLNPYSIYDFQETKTTWHPIEQIGGASAAY